MPTDTANLASYTLTQRILHWLTAVLVIYNLLLPDGMSEWSRSVRRTGSASLEQVADANIHAYVGIAILLFIGIRLVLRFVQGAPPTHPQEPAIFGSAAKVTHAGLYFLLVALPVTGMTAFYLGYDSVGEVHAEVLKVILWILIAAHVFGALVHQFYWKTNVLRRMTIG